MQDYIVVGHDRNDVVGSYNESQRDALFLKFI
jgi:hypothetical protein